MLEPYPESWTLEFEIQEAKFSWIPESRFSLMGQFLSKGALLSMEFFTFKKKENLEQKKDRKERGVYINQLMLDDRLRLMLCSSVELFDRCQNPGGMSYNGLYGEAPPERGSFFGSQVYERVGISLFEVYERVGRSVLEVCKKAQKDQQMYFMDVKKS